MKPLDDEVKRGRIALASYRLHSVCHIEQLQPINYDKYRKSKRRFLCGVPWSAKNKTLSTRRYFNKYPCQKCMNTFAELRDLEPKLVLDVYDFCFAHSEEECAPLLEVVELLITEALKDDSGIEVFFQTGPQTHDMGYWFKSTEITVKVIRP